MLQRERVFAAFRQALEATAEQGGVSPRSVAVAAHGIYCAGLAPEGKKPALVTFRKFVAGRTSSPEIVALLHQAGIRPRGRARLDHERVRSVFEEAVRRLESRLLQGKARPIDVVRRAHELYKDADRPEAVAPSRYTFQRLVYGKAGDPVIQSFLKAAFKNKP